MKMIYRIARTEMQTLFYSPVAWLIIVIFTFQVGMYFSDIFGGMVRNQELGYTLRSVTLNVFSGRFGLFTAVQQYLYFYIPLLTMGLMSRELGSGSIRLLYSSPVTNIQIILGKFLSMMFYGLILMFILFIFGLYGAFTIKMVDFPVILSGILGLYLLTCAYAAIGLFMSSLTSYQVVAAMGTLAVLAVLNFVGGMWQEIEFVRDITYWLSINGRAAEFINGLICSEDVLYFLIVIALFLTLAVLRLGYLSSRPKLMGFYDSTRTKVRTLTPNSQEIVNKMEGGLTITTYTNLLDEYYTVALPRYVNQDLDRFKQYRRFKPEIRMKYVYYYDKANNPQLDRRFPELSDRERMVKTANSWDLDTNMFLTPEQIREQIDLRPEGNRFVRQLKRDNGQQTFLRIFDDMYRHPFESEITAAFKRLVMRLPVVGFIKGHGERDCVREGDRDYNRFAQDKPFRYSLINQGFDFEEITLDKDIPEHLAILVLADVRTPFSGEEMQRLNRYIEKGGNILIAGEPRRQEIMNPIIRSLGVQFMPGRLVRPSENFQADFIMACPTPEAGELSYIFKEMIDRERVLTMPGCAGLEYTTDKGFRVTPLFVSDTVGCWNEVETTDFVDDTVRLNPAVGEVERTYTTALALSRKVGDKEQKIVILGDADCISNGEISISRKNVRAANYSLISGAFFWMSDEEVPIDVRRPTAPDNAVNIGDTGMYISKIGFMGCLPVALAIWAIFIWVRRRGR